MARPVLRLVLTMALLLSARCSVWLAVSAHKAWLNWMENASAPTCAAVTNGYIFSYILFEVSHQTGKFLVVNKIFQKKTSVLPDKIFPGHKMLRGACEIFEKFFLGHF